MSQLHGAAGSEGWLLLVSVEQHKAHPQEFGIMVYDSTQLCS